MLTIDHPPQARSPVKPFEFSKEVRNGVVKPGYSKSKLEKYLKANGNPDAIVIGSGIGERWPKSDLNSGLEPALPLPLRLRIPQSPPPQAP